VHDKEWEANYYNLKHSSTRSSATSLSTSCRSPSKEVGSESKNEILTTTRIDAGRQQEVSTLDASKKSKPFLTQVRPGNLVHDEEWEADYYDLKPSSTSSSATSLSTSCQSTMKEDGRESTKEILTTTRLDAGRQQEVSTLDASKKSRRWTPARSPSTSQRKSAPATLCTT
jgi:hypothetical protein